MTYAFISAILIASISLIGIIIFNKSISASRFHFYILPVAIGVFLGVIFFDLIPETLSGSENYGGIVIILGFLFFYILSHILKTYHHHHQEESLPCSHSAPKILIGDTIHNISDGIVIATTFLINPALGVITSIGIALHEVPQEIAEFGILIHAGYSKKKAIFYNLLSSSGIILGVIFVALFSASLEDNIWILTGLAAGNLLYIATADLIPELNESHQDHFLTSFLLTLTGLIITASLFLLGH